MTSMTDDESMSGTGDHRQLAADRQPGDQPRALRSLTHLQRLEAESIHIIREVVAECERPVMLYSIGKDSSVMLHLALKAFHPGEAAVSVPSRRYHLEIPRDDRIS